MSDKTRFGFLGKSNENERRWSAEEKARSAQSKDSDADLAFSLARLAGACASDDWTGAETENAAVEAADEMVRTDPEPPPAEPSTHINLVPLRRMMVLIREKRALTKRLADVEKQIAGLDDICQNELAMAGIRQQRVADDHGGMTLYFQSELWVYPKKTEDGRQKVVEVLRELGMDEFVKAADYSTSSLSALARDYEKNGRKLPEALLAVLDTTRKTKIRGRETK